MAGDTTLEHKAPIVEKNINTENLNFDELKFKGDDREKLVNFVKKNLDKLKNNAALKNKCKDFFKKEGNQKYISDMINKNEQAKNREITAIAYLLTALDWNPKQSNNPSPQDVADYFQNFQNQVNQDTSSPKSFLKGEGAEGQNISPATNESEQGEGGNPDVNLKETTTSTVSAWQENTEKIKKTGTETKTDTDKTETVVNQVEQKESNEKLELNNKRRHVLTNLGLKAGGKVYTEDQEWETTNFEKRSQQPPEVYQRTWHDWIYKFADNSPDLIYISDAEEKKWKIISQGVKTVRERTPNQVYTFDKNYESDGKNGFNDLVDDVDDWKHWEVWDFYLEWKKNTQDQEGSDYSWLFGMNKEDMYTKEKGDEWKEISKYKYTGDSWEEIKEKWEKEEKQREEENKNLDKKDNEKNNTKISEKEQIKEEKEKTVEDKQLEKVLYKYGFLEDIQEIAKMQHAISEVDENWKIEELKKENEKLNKNIAEYKKQISDNEAILNKKKDALNKESNPTIQGGLQEEIDKTQQKITQLESEKEKLVDKKKENEKNINELEKNDVWEYLMTSPDLTKKEYKKQGYKEKYGKYSEYKKIKLYKKQASLVKKLESRVGEIKWAKDSPELSDDNSIKKKAKEEYPLLTQVLESQKILLNLGKDNSNYTRNESDQIIKKWENNTTYTMDTYGRLIKNENNWDEIKQSFVKFTDKENGKNE